MEEKYVLQEEERKRNSLVFLVAFETHLRFPWKLALFLRFPKSEPWDSYKLDSNKKKSVYNALNANENTTYRKLS